MKLVSTIITAAIFAAIVLLTSCEGAKDNVPEGYVGLEKTALTHYYDTKNAEETINIKIIAADKESTDRVVKLTATALTAPGESPYFQLADNQLTIKAGSKSASTTIKVFPKRVIKNTYIQVICSPQWKDAKASQMPIRMIPK